MVRRSRVPPLAGPVRHTRLQTASTRLWSTRPMQASRAHNSGDTHSAIQYRAERDAHDRTHTGLTRRRSRQRAQRPANGRPEAPRARVHTRESALARRSRRRLRRSRRSATCGALARRPGRTACRDREVPGLGGRLKEPLPCRPLRAVGDGRAAMGRTSSNRRRKREAANESCVVLRIRSTNCAVEIRSTRHCRKLLQVQLSVRRRSGQGVAVHGAGRSARRACGGVDLLEKPARYVGSASWTRERPLEGVAHGRRAGSTRNLTLPKPARGATTSEHIPQSTLIMGNNCAQSEHTDDRG